MPTGPINFSLQSVTKTRYGSRLWLGTFDGKVAYTTDLGLTWQTANTGVYTGAGIGMKGMVFRDANNGLAYEGSDTYAPSPAGRRVARTSDGGRTWTVLPALWPGDIAAIAAGPGPTGSYYVGTGYTVTQTAGTTGSTIVGRVAVSIDDGTSWQPRINDDIAYRRVSVADDGQVWVATVRWSYTVPLNRMLLRSFYTSLNSSPVLPAAAASIAPEAHPNPTTGLVSLAHEAGSTVRVYDSAGRQYGCPEQGGKFDLSAAQRGLYFFCVTAADGHRYTQRVAVVE